MSWPRFDQIITSFCLFGESFKGRTKSQTRNLTLGTGDFIVILGGGSHRMRSPITVGRTRFSLKASHRRLSLKVSHRRDGDSGVARDLERDRYIAPPKRRR
jgi:hypothetical protein